MQYLILYILLAVLCIVGIKFNDYKSETVLTIQSKSDMLRGIFAIFVIYTHCTLAFDNLPAVLIPLRKVSTFGVGFFFILSGYGLAYSFAKKENYLKGFLSRKLSKILIAAVVSRVISELILFLVLRIQMNLSGILSRVNWFIYWIIIAYIVFYLVYKFVPTRAGRVIGVWAIIVLLTLLVLFYIKNVHNIGRSYYISQWAFAMGITIYEFNAEISVAIKKHFVLIDILMLILLAVTFWLALAMPEYTVLDLVSHNLMLLPFYYFVMVVCKYFTFDNAVLRFLKKISFEMYLYQFVILVILQALLPKINVVYFLLTVIITVVISWAVHTLSYRKVGL